MSFTANASHLRIKINKLHQRATKASPDAIAIMDHEGMQS